MIPNNIHFIFFGFTELSFLHYMAIKSAIDVHKPDNTFIYYNTEPVGNPLWDELKTLVNLVYVEPPTEFNGVALTSYQYKADILRLQILIEQGGIYLDIDAVSLKPFGDLLNNSCVMGFESGGDTIATAESITNAVILCEPNHPFMIEWLRQTGENLKDKNWAYHAVNLPLEMLRTNAYDVHLEPMSSFMPFGWKDKWVFGKEGVERLANSYTMHLWETIWKDELAMINADYLATSDSVFAQVTKAYARKLKIAVYTICKNEEQFVSRWSTSNQDADYRLVCDTGSTDGTVPALAKHNIDCVPITVSPWRFDVARNTALNLLPADIDICIWQDLDEELLPGWRDELEQHWQPGTTIANHRYRYNDGPWQWHSKVHARHNCRWTGAVHETLTWTVPELAVWASEMYLDEHQDTTKSRSSYLNLLLKKIQEGDCNWRTYYFLANDYQTIGDPTNSITYRTLSYDACGDGSILQSYVARNIARQYADIKDIEQAEKWFKISVGHSLERESYFSYAEFLYNQQRWDECYITAKKCVSIADQRDGFTYDSTAWGYLPYDYAAIAAYNIGLKQPALDYGKQALALNPTDARLKTNLEFYEQS